MADGQHEVAAGLDQNQIGVQNGGSSGYAEAVAGPEPLVDLGWLQAGMSRKGTDPQRVDLHRPEVVGLVGDMVHGSKLVAVLNNQG